jgi:hypothetical protein
MINDIIRNFISLYIYIYKDVECILKIDIIIKINQNNYSTSSKVSPSTNSGISSSFSPFACFCN